MMYLAIWLNREKSFFELAFFNKIRETKTGKKFKTTTTVNKFNELKKINCSAIHQVIKNNKITPKTKVTFWAMATPYFMGIVLQPWLWVQPSG